MKKVLDYLILTAGTAMIAVSVYFFRIPNNFVTGGVSGIGTILGGVAGLSAANWVSILNVLLLLVGFVFLGRSTGVRTVYCSLLYSGLTTLLDRLVPLSAPLTDQPLMELVYAMLLAGIGSAMIFHRHGSSGGTDIVALILRKYTRLDVGKALLCVDSVVAASSFFFFGVKAGLFSLLGLFSKAFLVDSVIESFNSCKYFLIITTKAEEISEYIMRQLHHGATVTEATGAYTKENKTVLHTVCRRAEAVRLQRKVRKIDPGAFMIVTTSSEIIGRGFRGD